MYLGHFFSKKSSAVSRPMKFIVISLTISGISSIMKLMNSLSDVACIVPTD